MAQYYTTNPDGTNSYAGTSYDANAYDITSADAQVGHRYDAVGGAYFLIPKPLPTGGFTPPGSSSAAAHLQFSASTVNTPIMLAYGRCKLPGQIIWASGIDASNSVLETSLLTFAAAYCEPIPDAVSGYQPIRMWANGTMFYDRSAGGVLAVANLSDVDQAALLACVNSMAVYNGDETQLPDPTMEGIIGVGKVPAYKGLRYIVFTDFPLAISNNGVPNIVVEWDRISGAGLLDVSAAMTSLIEYVNLRSEPRPIFSAPTVSGIDDLCYGLVINEQSSLIDHFTKHRNIYNFQIIEGDPITIIRREVGTDLVIDAEILEVDCIGDPGKPAVTFNRPNPSDFPAGINLSYTDPDGGFDIKVAQSTFEGSPPGNGPARSFAVLSTQSDYITDATTARSLSFSTLFSLRSYAARATFEHPDLAIEVGDVVQLTMSNGDVFIFLVDQQTVTKDRTNAINAMILLTQAGPDISGDAGRDGGTVGKKKWPQEFLVDNFIVTSDKVYTSFEFPTIFSMNSYPTPALKIGSSRYRNVQAADVSAANWGANSSFFPQVMFEDDQYVYWMEYECTVISRLAKTYTSINSAIQTITILEGWNNGGSYLNYNGFGNTSFCFRDGKLYIAWGDGKFNGVSVPAHDIKLLVIDIDAWDPAAWTIHDVYTYSSGFGPVAARVSALDNGKVVVSCYNDFASWPPANGSTFFSSDLSDLSTWTTNGSTFVIGDNERIQSSGNKIYTVEIVSSGRTRENHRIGIFDFGSGFSETIVDLTDDANIVAIAQIRGYTWVSDTHFFVICNHTNYQTGDHPVISPRRYIARRKLSDGSADGGVFLDEFMWNGFDFIVYRGHYFQGKNFIHLDVYGRASTRLVQIDEDLDPTSAVFWWPQQSPTPANNAFSGAVSITTSGTAKTLDARYCNTEANEPYPPWATATTGVFNTSHTYHNGHSQWFKFDAVATETVTITVDSGDLSDRGPSIGIVVWTGSDLLSLTSVASHTPASVGTGAQTLSFSATSGTTYYISTYFYGGYSYNFSTDTFGAAFDLSLDHYGTGTISLSA